MHDSVFLIQSASFIHLVCRCASLSTTFALSQSITWFFSTAWSVIADLWVTLLSLVLEARVCVPAVKESTSFLSSLILRPNFLPVSPTYELKSQFVYKQTLRSRDWSWWDRSFLITKKWERSRGKKIILVKDRSRKSGSIQERYLTKLDRGGESIGTASKTRASYRMPQDC